jgi:hypothetical protein
MVLNVTPAALHSVQSNVFHNLVLTDCAINLTSPFLKSLFLESMNTGGKSGL